MSQSSRMFRQDVNEAALRGEKGATGPVVGLPTHAWPKEKSDAATAIDSWAPFERLAVKTRSSLYEVIMLSGRDGEVLVRGGRFFPEFRRAILTGSTAGGSALKMRTIEVGLRMELCVDGTVYVTTPVQTLSRE